MPEETMTLRDAARRLARIRNPKGRGIESSKLLGLLRSGELKAGFYILDGKAWIEIPLTHWATTPGNKFRRIGRIRHEPKSGAYPVRANEFPDQVARTICKEIEVNERALGQHENQPNLEAITAVVDAAAKSYEVTIKTKEFSDYLQRQGMEETITTAKGGRPEKEGWRGVCRYMAAYMAAHYRDLPTAHLKIKESSDEIFRLANEDDVPDLPTADTIKEEVSKAIKLLERKDFHLKK